MKLLTSLSLLARVVLLGVLAGPVLLLTPAWGQAARKNIDEIDFDKARQAMDAGRLEEAVRLLEGIPVKYPTSMFIPAAMVGLGDLYFRMAAYDKAVKTLEAATKLKHITPDLKQRALNLLPHVQAARAEAEVAKSPQQKPGATPSTPKQTQRGAPAGPG